MPLPHPKAPSGRAPETDVATAPSAPVKYDRPPPSSNLVTAPCPSHGHPRQDRQETRRQSYQMTSVHDCQSMRSCSGILPFHTVLVTAPPRRLRTRRAFAASRPRRFPLGLAASIPPLCRGHTCPPLTEPPLGQYSSADAACSCSSPLSLLRRLCR
jgi:hypothetical protein